MALYSQTYDTPWSYGEEEVQAISPIIPLAAFNFTVTDATTGNPIPGALCIIYAGVGGTGDADGGYTDANGIFGIDAKWFVPRSWSVSKEGYQRKVSNLVVSDIHVALESTTVLYTVQIFAGTGGITDPSGTLTVAPSTEITVTAIPNSGYELDYWVYKGQNVGSENPLTFLIDRDAITITAFFNEVVEPPPNGEPPTDEWPHTVPVNVFNNEKLKAESWELGKSKTHSIINIDTALLQGGRLDYTVKYTQGSPLAERAKIWFEGSKIVEEKLSKGEARSGSVDLTGLIGRSATITISFDSLFGFWSEVQFDVWLVLGFSEEPPTPPGPEPFDWIKWFRENAWWMSLGVLGMGLIIIYRPSTPFIIYQPPRKRGE